MCLKRIPRSFVNPTHVSIILILYTVQIQLQIAQVDMQNQYTSCRNATQLRLSQDILCRHRRTTLEGKYKMYRSCSIDSDDFFP